MPRIAAMVIHRVEVLDVFIHEYTYDLEVAIRAIRETRFMERRPPKLILRLQSSVLEGVLQQLHEVHGQRHARHPRLDGYAVAFFRLEIAPVRIGI